MSKKRQGPERKKTRAATPILDDLPELQEARALWVKQDLLGALAKFERAAREHPNHVRALVDASRACGSMYRYDQAEALLDRLVALGRGNGQVLHLAGQSYRILRRPEQAIACFESALLGRLPTSDSHLELGLLFERRNQLEPALQHADTRLRSQPHDAEGAFLKARVQRRQGAWELAQQGLQAIVDQRTAHWMTRARAYAELAQLHDARGDYAAAWEAMLAGKQLTKPHAQEAQAHRERTVPPLMQLAREVTASHFARWREAAVQSPGDVSLALLTGLPRSGTTLLERMLDAHSRIVAGDEFDAFPRILFPLMLGEHTPRDLSPALLDQFNEAALAKQREYYAEAVSAGVGRPSDGRLLLDKNPSLLPLLTPYLRLAPRGRVIVMLRDPRDVLVSCLMAYLPLNDFSVDFLSLESAANRVVEDLESWLALRDKVGEACTEVRYESLVRDVRGNVEKVLSHLGLEWNDALDQYRETAANKTVYSPSYDSVAQPVHEKAVGRWANYEAQLAPVLPRLEAVARRQGDAL